ncbi:MAG: glycosyltransferase [Alistipes sp.]
MKVLQVNCVFQRGSTGKIIHDIHTSLQAKGHQSVVCYGRGDMPKRVNDIYKFCTEIEAKIQALLSRIGFLQYGGNYFATQRLIHIIKREQPDVVHLHCINGFCVNIYSLLHYLGKNKIKTIVTHHSEFFYTGSCGYAYDCMQWTSEKGCHKCPIRRDATYSIFIDRTHTAWQKMASAFKNFDQKNIVFAAVSPWVRQRSLLSPLVSNYTCEVAENGVETNIFRPATDIDQNNLKRRIPNLQDNIALHVTASFAPTTDNIKGGKYIVELAHRMTDTTFIVVATHIGDIDQLPPNVYLWGRAASQQELATLYSLAKVTVLVSKRETFSMICAESLCCGTPVVGFKAGGPETISIPDYSEFVAYGDMDLLKNATIKMLHHTSNPDYIAQQAHQRYAKETMTDRYIQIYQQLLGRS